MPFFLLDVPVDLVADRDALIAAIRAQVAGTPAVIVVDTLNRAIQGGQNASADMAKFIHAADALRTAFNCTITIVHHCGVIANRPRGHTSLAGANDAQISVERGKDGVITATVEHMKDGEAGAKLACKLDPVGLGNDTDNEPLSSCIIVPTDAGAAGPNLTGNNLLACDCLKQLIGRRGENPPADLNLPAGCRVAKQEDWREEFYARYHGSQKQAAKQKAFVRVHGGLFREHLIEYAGVYAWLKSDNPDNPDKSGF